MNRYGLKAQRYYARWAPTALAEIPEPETFFLELGDQIQSQVLQISQEMESQLNPAAPYLERVAQLRAVQRDAEEVAMTDLVYGPVLPELQGIDLLMEILGGLPSASALEVRAEQIGQAEQDEPETPVSRTAEEEAAVRVLMGLEAILPEIDDVPEMTDSTVAMHLDRLSEYLNEHRAPLQELRIV